jgi:hypothetical protein
MKTCPWCAEQIQDTAVKCPHCQSLLVGEKPDDKVLLYVDQGLIRFAKFASAVLGLFLIVGAALYGFDAQNAHKQAYEAQTAAQNAQHEAQNAQFEARKSTSDLQQWVDAEQRKLGEAELLHRKRSRKPKRLRMTPKTARHILSNGQMSAPPRSTKRLTHSSRSSLRFMVGTLILTMQQAAIALSTWHGAAKGFS